MYKFRESYEFIEKYDIAMFGAFTNKQKISILLLAYFIKIFKQFG